MILKHMCLLALLCGVAAAKDDVARAQDDLPRAQDDLPRAQDDFDPYTQGPHTLIQATVNATQYSPDLPTHLSVWAPDGPGNFPVLYFFDGFGASVPGAVYGQVLEHIASYGVVVVLPWKITLIADQENKVPAVQKVLDWCPGHLDDLLIQQGADANFSGDYNTSFGLAHSAGAHVVCSYLQEVGCNALKGLAYLSPVDGADPFGAIDSYCTQVGTPLNFDIPTLVLAAGLDDVPGLPFSNVSCAPAEISNRRFYEACPAESPHWFLNATDFGHADFMDPLFDEVVGATHFCATNTQAGTVQFTAYRRFVAGTAVSFLFSLLEEDCEGYVTYLEDTSLMPVHVLAEHVTDGGCGPGYCSWTPLPTPGYRTFATRY